jgi:outer membrane beta-barrel protein
MRPNLPSSLVISALTLMGASSARAGDDLDEEQVATYAVQSRMFRLGGELAVAGGVLPMNAFDKGLTVGGSFTYHFNNSLAWEIINASYVYKQLDTGLKTELLENFGVQPTDIASLDLLLSSSLVLKPFYGKLALFNRRVIHMELSVPVGVAMGRYINPGAYLAGPTAGLLFHVFLGPHTSVRFDARENVLINRDNWHMRHELHVSLGFALAWGGDER